MSYLIKFRNAKHLPASIACDEVSWARICIFEEKLRGILLWNICDVSVKYLVEKELQRTSQKSICEVSVKYLFEK